MEKLITKKTLLMFVLGLFMSMSVKAQVESVSLNHDTITLAVGDQETLIATVLFAGTINDSVIWSLDDVYAEFVEIDTVTTATDKDCIVKATHEGLAKVAVETMSGGFTDTCVVKVVVPVTGMTLKDGATMDVDLGRDTFLVAKILPLDATNDSVIWVSRDPSTVMIREVRNRYDTVCVISPLKPGTAGVVAETVDGNFKDSCEVTVVAQSILDFSFNDDTIDLYVNEDTTIIAHIDPFAGTYKYVEWDVTIDNPSKSVYTRIEPGYDTICKIRATGAGTAKIAAETYDGLKSDTCVIRVHEIRIDTMYMNVDTIYLDNKHTKEAKLIATVAPSEATDKSVSFTSNHPDVVDIISVEKDTICHINSGYSGEAYIYAETADGRFRDSCYVKVIVPVDSIVLRAEILRDGNYESEPITTVDQKTLTMDLVTDSVARLTAVVYPDSAKKFSFDTLIWSKFDPKLARIDSIPNDTTCYITALWSGYDTLHVRSVHDPVPDFKDWYFINIEPRKVDSIGITIDNTVVTDTIELNVGDSLVLETAVYPSNATSDSLELVSSRTDVLVVDSVDNKVFLRGLKEGVVIVRALATDFGNRKDTCIVKVSNVPLTGFALTKDTVRIYENETDSVSAVISPVNATDKTVSWSSSDAGIVAVQTTTDTVCTFKGMSADTAVIRAEIDGLKDSCVVIVQEQFAFVESDTTATNNGKIAFSLKLPEDITLTGSFELRLPEGFGLTPNGSGGYATALEAPYRESSDLTIVALNDSTYTFTVSLKASPANGTLRSASAKKKVMDIAYTIYNDDLENSTAVYDVRFVNVDFKLSDNTEIREDHTAKIKVFKDETGNEMIGDQSLHAYIADHDLYVNSVKAETVYVYALNGNLLFSRDKTEGQAVFVLNTPEKMLIVKGSSGWAQKVINP